MRFPHSKLGTIVFCAIGSVIALAIILMVVNGAYMFAGYIGEKYHWTPNDISFFAEGIFLIPFLVWVVVMLYRINKDTR